MFDGELIKRHVVVDRLDDPVAVWPNRALAVFLIAVGVGITGEIQPFAGPAFAIARRGEQAVHGPLVSVRGRVGEKRGEFLRAGWETGEIKTDTPEQRGFVRLRGGFQTGLGE